MAMLMVNDSFSLNCWKFTGNVNLDVGILSFAGRTPIGAGLQLPVSICLPFVIGRFTVAQKLIKLFADVKLGEATSPMIPQRMRSSQCTWKRTHTWFQRRDSISVEIIGDDRGIKSYEQDVRSFDAKDRERPRTQ